MRTSHTVNKELDGMIKLAANICQASSAFICIHENENLLVLCKRGIEIPETLPYTDFFKSLNTENFILEITGADNIHTLEKYLLSDKNSKINFLAAISLKNTEGISKGFLCIFDLKPQKLSQSQKESLIILGDCITTNLETHGKRDQLKSGIKRVLEKRFARLGYYHNAILNGADYCVIYTDINGLVKGFNKGAEKMLGYKAVEIIDKISLPAFHIDEEINHFVTNQKDNSTVSFHNYARKASSGITDINDWIFRRKDGSVFNVQFSLRAIHNEKREIIGYLAIAEDISPRKKTEEDLKRAKILAEKSNQAKDHFLANMSHEIRTPMNAIMGFTDILWTNQLNEEQRECVDAIKSAGQNLLGIINDILDFSKIESGKLTLEKTPFYLKETVLNTCSLLKVKAKQKGLQLKVLMDPFLPDVLQGDEVRLNQILYNLIGNAIKFTEDGEVKVSVTIEQEDTAFCKVKFVISDTGIGIPEDKMTSIFERFTQASSETTRKYGGTGLGLSISKNLIEMYGGILNVSSVIGEGSEFSFKLNFDKISSEVAVTKKSVLEHSFPTTKVKILLVEDNELNQKLAKKVITGFGFEFALAENGKIAIEKLRTDVFDLILMDLQMPEMDGYQTTQAIRSDLELNIPIMAMTAHSLVGEKDKCLEVGMNDYISKPFKAEDLHYKICQLLHWHSLNKPNPTKSINSAVSLIKL